MYGIIPLGERGWERTTLHKAFSLLVLFGLVALTGCGRGDDFAYRKIDENVAITQLIEVPAHTEYHLRADEVIHPVPIPVIYKIKFVLGDKEISLGVDKELYDKLEIGQTVRVIGDGFANDENNAQKKYFKITIDQVVLP